MKTKTEVVFLSALCGVGKTHTIIEQMKNNPDEKYIYVGCLLSELQRISLATDGYIDFKTPTIDKDLDHNTKRSSFLSMIKKGESILTTHSLFTHADRSIIKEIKEQGYILVIDEELNCVFNQDINKATNTLLFEDVALPSEEGRKIIEKTSKFIVNDDGLILKNPKWTDLTDNDILEAGLKENVLKLIQNKNLYLFDKKFFSFIINRDLFLAAKKTYVISYLLQGSVIHSYLNKNNIKCTFWDVLDGKSKEKIKEIKKLIDFVDLPCYKKTDVIPYITNKHSFTSTSVRNKKVKSVIKKIMNGQVNYLKKEKIKADDVIYTTYKGFNKKNPLRHYSKSFISINTRGTELYSDRSVVIYNGCVNQNPSIIRYLNNNNDILFDNERFKLACILQLLFRSRLRHGKMIKCIIPNQHLKKMVVDWLEGNDSCEHL